MQKEEKLVFSEFGGTGNLFNVFFKIDTELCLKTTADYNSV